MLGISSRLVQVQQAASPPTHTDNEEVIAGRMSENEVYELFCKVGGMYASDLFRSLRVPDDFQTRRHEIDLVVLSSYGLYCIEVKNWGGEIKLCEDSLYWEQVKSNKGKHHVKQVQYANPLTEVKHKSQILRNHLLRAGIALGEGKFFPCVLLTNKNCQVDEEIANDKCVITSEKLHDFVASFSRSIGVMLTDPFIPYFFRGQLSYSQIEQIRCALNQIGTWDVLNLHGGRKLIGDYKGCKELSFNRKDVEEISFLHQRNAVTASLWAVLGYMPQTTAILYKRGSCGWFKRETTASVIIPYNHDIGFRIAGETTDAKIPANDISNILLSK